MEEMIEAFKEDHAGEAQFEITISEEDEKTCRDTVLADPEGAADLYSFASDQFDDLQRAEALLAVTDGAEQIISDNGGKDSAAILSSSKDGVLYAYPMVASNGYFMYYNSAYFTEEDVATFDGMLEIAAQKGKKVAMDYSGGWYIYSFEEAYKENYNAAKLPTFTLAGEQVQMHSFAGYKLLGINAHTKEPEWAMRLASWLTNEENQTTRFRKRGEGPSNVKAAASEEVQAAPAIKALGEQSQYSHIQHVAETFWTPTFKFGTTIAGGNRDGADLQKLLDDMTEEITSMPEE